ncbi:putative ATP-dependent helicase MG140 [Mycoplasma genitalium G37] [Rhizoctonia solani]|uniref:Putative ATP-dependent helicase MG140 [Mycoplasma genitalium G37] n=1 Tax=Rhizoctonia solani TaxID=456999 RepID=A0A0K6G319_9AGAM|nr:putative ATP-dependent helicase MG140 [Mycoplasma genitalium G37] [Rhizoctonia solani]
MSASRRRISAYVLIIAISGHGLVAPEHDARRLHDAFIQFEFPENHIKVLVGAQATRQAIIHQLRSISANPNIIKNAPIFIYYAGHGAKQQISVPGLGTVVTECILPYDAIASRGQIPPIPDITISALLGEIARAKGDYITLLLDCCHAGSGSRSADDDSPTGLPEDLHFDQDSFENEDGDIWSEFLKENDEEDTGLKSRSISTTHPGSFRYQGIKSHVLIASCGENEKSFEFSIKGQPPSGLFTRALLEALDDCRLSNMIWDVTYIGLFSRIKDFMVDLGQNKFPQTPQCEGYHRERHVFATPAFPHRNHAIAPITEVPQRPGQYLLPVGELAGVRPESEFEIYDYSRGQPFLKGRFRVLGTDNRGGSVTTIQARNDLELSPDAYAVLCALPTQLPIDLAPDLHQVWNSQEFQSDLGKRLNSHYPIQHFITPVRSGHPSKLRVSPSRSTGGVKIEPTDGRGRPIVLRSLRIPRLSDALAKAIMFYHHLERQVISPRETPFVFQAVELLDPAPEDPNYLGALVEDPRQKPITFRPNEETHIYGSNAQFGLHIENHAKEAYYVYVFYFDPNDFSITPIYLPPTDQASVTPRSSLKIGYGNSGAAPLMFTVDRHLHADPGFFKIFYSISPSEMSTIQQDGVDPDPPGDPRPGTPYYQPSAPLFGSILYPMAVLNPHPRH